jgi:hypothetical protein
MAKRTAKAEDIRTGTSKLPIKEGDNYVVLRQFFPAEVTLARTFRKEFRSCILSW